MILVVVHTEVAFDHEGKATGCPARCLHAVSLRSLGEDTREFIQLVRS